MAAQGVNGSMRQLMKTGLGMVGVASLRIGLWKVFVHPVTVSVVFWTVLSGFVVLEWWLRRVQKEKAV